MTPPLWLRLRRLWWFVSDHETHIDFTFPCIGCGETVVLSGEGLGVPLVIHDEPWCHRRRNLVLEESPYWVTCWGCWKQRYYCWRIWVLFRWRFRLKYNWGWGVPACCRMGIHDFQPRENWEENGRRWIVGLCAICGFAQKFDVTDIWQALDDSVKKGAA